MATIRLPDAPRDEDKNVKLRQYLSECSANFPDFREALVARWKEDKHYFFDTAIWSLDPKWKPLNPEFPVICWPFQANYITKLSDHIDHGKRLLLVEKSREQAVTVTTMALMLWYWLFTNRANFKVASLKEDLVDGKSFSDQIFPKFDYYMLRIKEFFPWVIPQGYYERKENRSFLNIRNPETTCVIRGAALGTETGRSGRYQAFWADEAAGIPKLEVLHRAVANTTNCVLYTGTPQGWNYFAKLATSKSVEKVTMHWTDNPSWQAGRYECEPGKCRIHEEGGKPHSDKYDQECEKYNWDIKSIAQELDIDYARSGNSVFDLTIVKRVRDWIETNQPQFTNYRVEWNPSVKQREQTISLDRFEQFRRMREWPVQAQKSDFGPFKILAGHEPYGCRDKSCLCKGTGRHVYFLGGDVGKGLDWGDFDAGFLLDCTVGKFIGMWHGHTDPMQLGEEWAKICKWAGQAPAGNEDCWAAVEWNDVGCVVNQVLDELGIMLHIGRSEDKRNPKILQQPGVVVSKANRTRIIKKYLMPELHTLDVNGMPAIGIPFDEFWQECETFITIGTRTLDINDDAVKMGGMRGSHDDLIFGAAHTIYGAIERFGRIRGELPASLTEQIKSLEDNFDPQLQLAMYGSVQIAS